MATFSLIEKLTPGVCSPSRRLVSKNSTLRIDNPLSKSKNDSSKKTSHSETQARCFYLPLGKPNRTNAFALALITQKQNCCSCECHLTHFLSMYLG